jgi:hypothetical protein
MWAQAGREAILRAGMAGRGAEDSIVAARKGDGASASGSEHLCRLMKRKDQNVKGCMRGSGPRRLVYQKSRKMGSKGGLVGFATLEMPGFGNPTPIDRW